MKILYHLAGITALCLFIWLAAYSYQHRIHTLAQLIDRSNQELVEHKLTQLYGDAYGVH